MAEPDDAGAEYSFPRPGTLVAFGVVSLVIAAGLAQLQVSDNKVTAFSVLGTMLLLIATADVAVHRYWRWRSI